MVTEGGYPRLRDATYYLFRQEKQLDVDPMTVVVAISAKDGVILYTDSQETEVSEDGIASRRSHQLKLYILQKDRYALGCAGASDDIREFRGHLIPVLQDEKFAHLDPIEMETKLDREIIPQFLEEVRINRKRKFAKKVPLEFDCTSLLTAKFGDNEYKIYRIEIDISDKKNRYIAKAKLVSQLYVCIGHDQQKVDVFLGALEHLLSKYDMHFGKLSLKLCGMFCQLAIGLVLKKAVLSGGTIHALKVTEKGVGWLGQDYYWDMKKDVIAQTVLQTIKEVRPPKETLVRFASTLFFLEKEDVTQLIDSWMQS